MTDHIPSNPMGISFQQRVYMWMLRCFGQQIASDTMERNHRFLEESLELVQAGGCSKSEALQLVEYVYGRPSGVMSQEVGGVAVTLAALCSAFTLDLEYCSEAELSRVWTKIEQIRAKQAAKPKYSPLPANAPETSAPLVKRHSRDCGCLSCHYSKKHPQVKPHHATCGCFECAPRKASIKTCDDLGNQIYALLVRRGYAQHEAHLIANGPGCTSDCVQKGYPDIDCPEHGSTLKTNACTYPDCECSPLDGGKPRERCGKASEPRDRDARDFDDGMEVARLRKEAAKAFAVCLKAAPGQCIRPADHEGDCDVVKTASPADWDRFNPALGAPTELPQLCEDCPPAGYPTDKTRCTWCPRRAQNGNPQA